MTDANEATRCEFISSILHASIAIAKKLTSQDIFIVLQKDISGEDATGRVDYAIKSLEDLLCITEGKPRNIKIGYAQNLAQLESAFQTNKKKRTADQAFGNDYFDYIYGIVTTGTEWHFIIYTLDGIFSTSGSEYQINLTKSAVKENPELLRNNVKRVIGIIVGLLKDRRIIELEAENAEIPDLRRKISEFDAERAEFKRRIAEALRTTEEERTRRVAENAKLNARIEELESEFRDRITKVEQKQTQNDNSSNNNSSNFNLVAVPEAITVPINSANGKSLEEKDMDSFLLEAHKKIVSSEIKQRNKEKKLCFSASGQAQESLPISPEEERPQVPDPDIQPCNSSTSEVSENVNLGCPISDPVIHNQKRVSGGSRSHKKKGMDELKHELFNPSLESEISSSINHNNVTEISETARPGKVTYDNINEASQHLAQLCDKAIDAEDRANRANQEEILCWCLYWKDFRNQLDEIIRSGDGKFGEKKARSILYDTITEQLSILRKKRSQELGLKLKDISRDNLRKKTQRAEKNYKLFEKVGLDKIKYINSYSANSISELTDAQFQEIIDYGISFEKLSSEADHVTEISETARPEKILPDVNAPSTPQITPAKADDNDLTDLKEEDFCGDIGSIS
ncbi:hypothetical protein GLOIN_2v1652170 [Rhizophagus clarus]|uniref:Uncharacterized protein n=1 Tax=Rhizophagus clarus TaxID=94130 RepID=A0A8H3L0D7_9GLOM|nr:hypothetical protein GLOIN_2v1652170 [Rhizophagus clarus]